MYARPELPPVPPSCPLFPMHDTYIQVEVIERGQEGDGEEDSEGMRRVAEKSREHENFAPEVQKGG